MKKVYIQSVFFIFLTIGSWSQNCIKGKVVDAKTGETLPGASIVIEGTTKGSNTDFDGNFSICDLEPGNYNLLCKFISYATKRVENIQLKNGTPAVLTFTMEEPASQELKEVVVTAQMNKENTSALLLMQKNNTSVSDGISSESIKRTPDKSTSDVLKRVSGASIQDNKFAIIRGMNDRYNAAYINGAPLPSSESDKKAFSFDIFPANLLDNLIIVKTATPDLPGEFAGGVILVNTKSIPEKNEQLFSVSLSGNSLTTFKDFRTYQGGKFDWLGIDDGKRKLSSVIPSNEDYKNLTIDEKANYAKEIKTPWELSTKKALPGGSFQFSSANTGKIFNKEAGSIFSITYNNSFSFNEVDRREFEESNINVFKRSDFKDKIYINNILASALWNASYKLNDNNQINFKNIFSVNSDDKVTERTGLRDAEIPQWEKASVRWFTENKLYTAQLSGDHLLPHSKVKIKWIGGLSDINRSIPNMSRMVYRKESPNQYDSIPYTAVIQQSGVTSQTSGSMFFSKTKEQIYSAKTDISLPFQLAKTKHELKVGGSIQLRDRSFNARLLGFSKYRKGSSIRFVDSLLALPEEQIFSQQNMALMNLPSPYNGGFVLDDGSKSSDSYTASSTLNAAFLMLDSKINDKIRIVYGARIESYNQKFNSKLASNNEEVKLDTTVVDLLPSINTVFSVTEKSNIRFAYYRTLSRPEFRELAPFNFYDFITDFTIGGDLNLKRASIDNYDLRYEYYPGAAQLISASVFYKEINNAIEQISLANPPRYISFANVPKVKNVGIELEYRFKLSSIFKNDSNSILEKTTLYTNFSYIKSRVDVSNVIGATSRERSLQGQSPYIANAGLQYLDVEKGVSISASYNIVGDRIYIVGNIYEPDFYEKSRHVIDLQITKTFFSKLELKLNFKDILAQPIIIYQDINKNKKFDSVSLDANKEKTHSLSSDNVMVNTQLGRVFSISASYRF